MSTISVCCVTLDSILFMLTMFTAHLGGLLMGLLMGMAFYPIISPSTRHRAIVIGFRLAAIPIAIVLFVVLIRNFYESDPYAGTCSRTLCIDWPLTAHSACTWCRYLSCIPTSANDHCQGYVRLLFSYLMSYSLFRQNRYVIEFDDRIDRIALTVLQGYLPLGPRSERIRFGVCSENNNHHSLLDIHYHDFLLHGHPCRFVMLPICNSLLSCDERWRTLFTYYLDILYNHSS